MTSRRRIVRQKRRRRTMTIKVHHPPETATGHLHCTATWGIYTGRPTDRRQYSALLDDKQWRVPVTVFDIQGSPVPAVSMQDHNQQLLPYSRHFLWHASVPHLVKIMQFRSRTERQKTTDCSFYHQRITLRTAQSALQTKSENNHKFLSLIHRRHSVKCPLTNARFRTF